MVLNKENSVTGVGFRWRIVGDMTGWLGSSVVECSQPRSSHNFSPVTNGAQRGSRIKVLVTGIRHWEHGGVITVS